MLLNLRHPAEGVPPLFRMIGSEQDLHLPTLTEAHAALVDSPMHQETEVKVEDVTEAKAKALEGTDLAPPPTDLHLPLNHIRRGTTPAGYQKPQGLVLQIPTLV